MTESEKLKVIEKYKSLSTPAVSDALDRLGIKGGCEGIKPLFYGIKSAGFAVTLKYLPVSLAKESVGDYIDDITETSMLVLDNNGRLDCTVWGGILTVVAKRRNISGTIIDGVCRDVETVNELEYPLWSRGHFMVTGKERVGLVGFNVPVSLSKVRVNPDDLIFGDNSGVVVIPYVKIAEVLEVALNIEEAEEKIVESVNSGLSLREAREKYNYHKLQSKR